jgi:hypothetical protein
VRQGEERLRQKDYNHVNILVAADDAELRGYYKRQGYEEGNKYLWMVKKI